MSSHLIFLVDDEPLVRQLLEHQVTTVWGHTARTFPDAESCLAALDESPDLIIMDIGLPGIGGVEALRQVHEADPGLPVIMLSAQESVDVAVSTWKLGAHDYLTKPPDLIRLEASVRAALHVRTLTKEVQRLRESVRRSGNFANFITNDGRKQDILARLFEGSGAIIPLERLRVEAVRHALKVTGGNILHAARQLGVGRATFYRLMKKYGIPFDR